MIVTHYSPTLLVMIPEMSAVIVRPFMHIRICFTKDCVSAGTIDAVAGTIFDSGAPPRSFARSGVDNKAAHNCSWLAITAFATTTMKTVARSFTSERALVEIQITAPGASLIPATGLMSKCAKIYVITSLRLVLYLRRSLSRLLLM